MVRIVKIYIKLQSLHLRTHLEYEADFWIGICGIVLKHSMSFVFIWTLFSLTTHVQGWGLWEMAFLYALYIIPLGLVELFYDGQWQLPQLVNLGEFDRLLLRPISPMLQVITQISSIHGIGSVLIGIIILLRAIQALDLSWSLWQYGFLIVTLLNSVLLIGSLNFITNCTVFWDSAPTAALPVLAQNLTEFAKYPSSLYSRFVQALLIWVLPMSFVSYFPSLVLLGKPDRAEWLGYAAPGVGIVALLITGVIWRHCLLRYQGAGS